MIPRGVEPRAGGSLSDAKQPLVKAFFWERPPQVPPGEPVLAPIRSVVARRATPPPPPAPGQIRIAPASDRAIPHAPSKAAASVLVPPEPRDAYPSTYPGRCETSEPKSDSDSYIVESR